ncbi:MAG TPA: PRC-barrel domain-containing protein [Anaerolineaceae bacterium]|nr:PRC-barrel domain-containing protein [Anaerolineaceae bacterium]
MFFNLQNLREYSVVTPEGAAGRINDFILHDFDWIVRYAIIDLEDDRRDILMIPDAFDRVDRETVQVSIPLSREMLHQSPVYHPDQPLSRSLETEVFDYFQWPYWDGDKVVPTTGPGDLTGVPLAEMEADLEEQQDEMLESEEEIYQNLKRFSEISGFRLRTRDGDELGHLEDFIIQTEDWRVMYAIVSLGGLLSARQVIVSPSLMESINRDRQEIIVGLTAETIQASPEFDERMLTDPNFDWGMGRINR